MSNRSITVMPCVIVDAGWDAGPSPVRAFLYIDLQWADSVERLYLSTTRVEELSTHLGGSSAALKSKSVLVRLQGDIVVGLAPKPEGNAEPNFFNARSLTMCDSIVRGEDRIMEDTTNLIFQVEDGRIITVPMERVPAMLAHFGMMSKDELAGREIIYQLLADSSFVGLALKPEGNAEPNFFDLRQ